MKEEVFFVPITRIVIETSIKKLNNHEEGNIPSSSNSLLYIHMPCSSVGNSNIPNVSTGDNNLPYNIKENFDK